MGGCQNYGQFFGYPKYEVPYFNRDPKRDHNFDNHPHIHVHIKIIGTCTAEFILGGGEGRGGVLL